jgi:tripartite motif-containing protein 71
MRLYSDSAKRFHEVSHSQLALLLAFVLIICCANSVTADEGAFYVDKWGGEGGIYFDGPSGVAIDSTGHIYVADRGNNRIKKFAPNGDHVLSWGGLGTADGEFNSPEGIAIDNSDNLYVADTLNHRIQKFDSSGTFLRKWGTYGKGPSEFDRPNAVAVRGILVYVADTNNHRIQEFQVMSFGVVFASEWGGYGTGEGEFKSPRGIAVDLTGNIYVADSTNNRIQQFNSSKTFVRFCGGTAQFSSPRGLALDSNGALYVSDFNNDRIVKLAYGYYIGEWGGYGTGAGKFYLPKFVAVGDVCTIIVSDSANNRVQKFACDNSNFRHKWGREGTLAGEFKRPQGIAVDDAGNVYVADTNNHRIQKFNANGGFVLKWGGFGPGDSEFKYPTSVAVDRENNVYVADRDNNRIQKFTSNGAFIMKWSGYSYPLDRPTHVSVDDTFSHVWVVDAQKMWKFTKTGLTAGSVGADDGSNYGYLKPRSVTPDRDPKNLSSHVFYVTNPGSTTPDIRKYLMNYPLPFEYNYTGRQEGTFHGLAVDRDHNFYTFNSSTDRIQKFVSTFYSWGGSYVYFHEWGSSGSANRQFNGPRAIVVDKNCNIYVVDTDNHRIQKFSTVPALNIF